MRWGKRFVYQNEESGDGSSSGGGDSSGPAEELSSQGDDSSVNWDSFEAGFDDEDTVVEGELEVTGDGTQGQDAPVTQAPVTPTAQPAGTPPAAAAAVPASQPAQPPQSAPLHQTQAPSGSAGSVTPEVYGSWRDKRLGELQQHYGFSEEDSAALLTEPEVVIPKLAAQLHMEVLENSMRAMQAMVPVMMEQIKQHTEVNSRAQNLFTSINPDLADPSYEPAIMQLGMTYRQMNKTASAEEASRAIGNLVRAALGMQSGGQTQQVSQPRPAAPAPFIPTRGGGGGANRLPTSNNPFEALASEMLADESGW